MQTAPHHLCQHQQAFSGLLRQASAGISRDNLHFTEKGYAIWADAVLPYIKKYCRQ